MNEKLSTLLLVAAVLLTSACTSTGGELKATITQVGPYYPASSYVALSYGQHPGPHNYEQLGYIRVEGGRYSRMSELVSELRHKAKAMGADAVIGIQTSQMQREIREGAGWGLLSLAVSISDPEYHHEPTPPEPYQALVIDGVAIKYLSDQ